MLIHQLQVQINACMIFEKAFECKVEVELLKSIKMGDEKCLMKITPQGTIWK